MACNFFCDKDGKVSAIVCTREHRAKACSVCGKPSNKLCARCAKSVPDDKDTFDLCKVHADFFICPKCRHGHDRGPVNGVDAFRRLNCGETTVRKVLPTPNPTEPSEGGR